MNNVPEEFAFNDLNCVLKASGMTLLYAGEDPWGPKEHYDELVNRKANGEFAEGG